MESTLADRISKYRDESGESPRSSWVHSVNLMVVNLKTRYQDKYPLMQAYYTMQHIDTGVLQGLAFMAGDMSRGTIVGDNHISFSQRQFELDKGLRQIVFDFAMESCRESQE